MSSRTSAQRAVNSRNDEQTVHARRWWTLGVLCLSLVLVVAGNSSLNVALPSLVRELGATNSELQWIVDAYSLVFAALLLPMGAIGDRFGRKGLLQIGLGIFAAGALIATVATVPWQIIATRAVMGAGAAMIMPATLSLLTTTFPPEERARAIAIWAGFAGAGAAIGPVMSGVLLDHFWFGSVFFINVPIIIVALGSGAVLIPTSRDPERRKLDPVGAALSLVGLTAMLYALIEAPTHGWAAPITIAGLGLSVIVIAGFVLWERHTDHPMLPIVQFGDRRFTMGAVAIGLAFFALFGLFFVLTQYLQFVLGYSPLHAGLATLPMAAMMIVFAPRSAQLSQRWGRDRTMSLGLGLVAVGMLAATLLSPDTSYWQVLVSLLLFGAGMGLVMAPGTGAIMEAMPVAKAGVGSAVNDTTREVGGSLGIAVLGSVLSSGYRSAIADNLPNAPASVVEGASESIGAALGIAAKAPPQIADPLGQAARSAFTDALVPVFVVAAAVAALAAVLVLRFMPSRPEPGEAYHREPIAEQQPDPG